MSLTCVTTGKPKEYRTPEFAITLRSISEHLFWGFVAKQTRYSKYRIAEPEKALLDWVYLTMQSGLTPRHDEMELQSLDKQKLVKYANKYLSTGSKITALVLGWVEDSVLRSDSQGFGVAGSFLSCAFASIAW